MSRRCGAYALVLLCACSSSKPPVGGVGVDAPPLQASAGLVDAGTDAPADGGADAAADGGKRVENGLINNPPPPDTRPISQRVEEDYGLTLTDKDKLIFDTCPRRLWSTNVPDRACTKDEECGGGFCDRGGYCQPIHTCSVGFGSPCKDGRHCPGMCVDGRCQSCLSDEECEQKMQQLFPESKVSRPRVCILSSHHGVNMCF